jgi:Cft2 family RNA processing exonuclease
LLIESRQGGVWLPQLGLWLDPSQAVRGPERVFVSHAHSDHTARHQEVILTEATARLMRARIGGRRVEHVLPFGEPRLFAGGPLPFQITLLPAGHILGSAMALLEAEGESLLYTGDFKLHRSLTAGVCEPCLADVLVMETTFGRPQYRFPPDDAVWSELIHFCRETTDGGATAVLLAYSLGKSQELLCGLAGSGLTILLHNAAHKVTQVYEEMGQRFPPFERYEVGPTEGKVLICPPNVARSAWLRGLGRTRVAVCTGWAVDRSCRFRSGADAAFPLSDHADFPDLIEMVKRVGPRKVFTLHGSAADFAQTLRARGYDAQALGEDEQMLLPLDDHREAEAFARTHPR